MSWLSTSRRTFIEAQITWLESQITATQTTIASLTTQEVDDYSFSTGAGAQRATRKKLEDLYKTLEKLYRTIEWWQSKIDGSGIVDMNLRRRPM